VEETPKRREERAAVLQLFPELPHATLGDLKEMEVSRWLSPHEIAAIGESMRRRKSYAATPSVIRFAAVAYAPAADRSIASLNSDRRAISRDKSSKFLREDTFASKLRRAAAPAPRRRSMLARISSKNCIRTTLAAESAISTTAKIFLAVSIGTAAAASAARANTSCRRAFSSAVDFGKVSASKKESKAALSSSASWLKAIFRWCNALLNCMAAAVVSAFALSRVISRVFKMSAVANAAHMHETAPAPGVGRTLATRSRNSDARKLQILTTRNPVI
jgi:hypothetical protein